MATLYVKVAGGAWSAAGTWSNTSSAGADSSGPPVAGDNCIAELASGALTVDSGAVCRSFDTTSGTGNYAGTITHNAITWTIGDGTAGAGNVALKLNSGVTYTLVNAITSAVTFASTSGTQQTIDFGAKSSGNVTINGAGSSYQLTANVTMTTGGWTYTAGTSFDANGKTITISARGVSPAFAGGGMTYSSVSITSTTANALTISGANTFANLTLIGPASKSPSYVLAANQTVTGTNMPTFTGNSVTNRLLITSDVRGTQRTITNTSTTPAVTNCNFEDIAFSTATNLSAVSGNTGDCGGNSGITFTSGQTNYATSNNNYSESTTAVWFLGTGGSGGAGRVPLPQDIGIFEMTAGSKTITLDMPQHGALSFAGIANTPALTNNTAATFYGSLTLSSGLGTYSGTALLTFSTRSSISITSAGKTFTNSFVSDAPGGTVTLADAFIQTGTSGWVHTQGTHAVSNVSATYILYSSSNTNTRTITQGSVTPTLTGNAATIWSGATLTNCTFTTRPTITCNYSGATGTRTISHGSSAGGTEANALDVNITSGGTDTIARTSGIFLRNLNFTGFSGTTFLSGSAFTLYGNLTVPNTIVAPAGSQSMTLAATSGTQVITSNTVNFDFPITINAPGATVQLADALAVGTATSRALTLTGGTLDLNGKALTLFGTVSVGSGATTRAIVNTAGSGSIIITQTATATVWTYTGTNFTTSNTWTIKISGSTANNQAFQMGGAAYSNVWYTNATGSGIINFLGGGTFADLKCTDANTQAVRFETTKTFTVTTFTVTGAAANLITITSCTSTGTAISTGTHTLTKASGGTISCDYLSLAHSVAGPSSTWYAGVNSTNNQGTATAGSGWVFTAPPSTSVKTRNGLAIASVKTVNGLAIASVKIQNGLA